MSKDFLIADLHFGHDKIIEYEDRPFINSYTMDRQLIKNWNRAVSKRDRVFVLGDISFHKDDSITQKIISSLNGHKILVLGNHDKHSTQFWLNMGFQEVSRRPIIHNEFIIMSHKPPEYQPKGVPYFYIYGHVHSSEMYQTVTETSACVSVERWNYTPVALSEILKRS